MEDTADERFSHAVDLAKRNGYIAINPWQENKSFCEWPDAVIAGLRLLRKCDKIMLCRGWQKSAGCIIEQKFAETCGISVEYEEELEKITVE